MKIRIEGLADALTELDKFGKPSLVKAPVQEGSEMIKNMLTEYPPYGGGEATATGITMLKSKPGSKYKRTGQLARGWKYRTREYVKSWAGFITNDVPYVSLVQDDKSQTAVHRGFWRTTSEVLEIVLKKITAKYNRRIDVS